MNRPTANRLALVMFGTFGFAGVTLAQEPAFVVSSARPGASEQTISISQRVSYADLNLATTSGSREMEERVKSTARTLCEKLEQTYPHSGNKAETCVRDSVTKGMADVRLAIAAAEKKALTAGLVSRE